MTPLGQRYTALSALLDERAPLAADRRALFGLCLAGFLVTLLVRLLDLGNWESPLLWAGQERILATHDAYCWLAGAKGVNSYASFGMSRLAAWLAKATGAPLWSVAFWTPAVLGSLTAVATALWAWLLAGRRAVLAAALLGALSPAFYYRSRLGYYDSDVFTQLMPLVLGLFLAGLLRPYCARAWLGDPEEAAHVAPPAAWLPWAALGFGLVARVAHFAHDDIQPLGVGLFWIALCLAALRALPGRRAPALALLCVYALAAYGGPRRYGADVFALGAADIPGLILALALAWLLAGGSRRLPAGAARLWQAFAPRAWAWVLAIGVLALACGLLLPLGPLLHKAASYIKPVAEAGAAAPGAPSYPGITQSIREAKNVADLEAFLGAISPFALTGALGLLGLGALMLLRPTALLLLPSTALCFASLYFGARFSMFGGPVAALGLGIGLHWLVLLARRAWGWRESLAPLAQVTLALVCLALVYAPRYTGTRATPVLAPPHAQALMLLRETAPRDAEVWTWWDFGYATQYYAERMTPSDGGRHAGRDIFATALALTATSPRQSAQMIRLSAAEGNEPARRWDAMGAQAAQREVESLAARDLDLPPPSRPQYLVVCWENVNLLYWMRFYGSWDLAGGGGRHTRVSMLNESLDVNTDSGALLLKRSNVTLPLAGAVTLTPEGPRPVPLKARHPEGPHLVMNQVTGQAVLLEREGYDSMAVQLLIGDPQRPEYKRQFKLVHEGFPLVRIYEVLPRPSGPAAQAEDSPT